MFSVETIYRRAVGMKGRLAAAALVLGLAVAVSVIGALSAPQARAATWHTVEAGADQQNRKYSVTLNPSRPTRLKYMTGRVLDIDDGEFKYDWVRFRLIRKDTSEVVKQVGPLYSPTGYQNWHTAGITLPSGVRRYTLRVTCDDALWGFRLQQRY
jgi:hypothetical protein